MGGNRVARVFQNCMHFKHKAPFKNFLLLFLFFSLKWCENWDGSWWMHIAVHMYKFSKIHVVHYIFQEIQLKACLLRVFEYLGIVRLSFLNMVDIKDRFYLFIFLYISPVRFSPKSGFLKINALFVHRGSSNFAPTKVGAAENWASQHVEWAFILSSCQGIFRKWTALWSSVLLPLIGRVRETLKGFRLLYIMGTFGK